MRGTENALDVSVVSRRAEFVSRVMSHLKDMGIEGRAFEKAPEGLVGLDGLLFTDEDSSRDPFFQQAALRSLRSGRLEIEILREPDPFAVELAVLRYRLNNCLREDLDQYRSSLLILGAVTRALNRPLSDEDALPSALRELALHFGCRRYALIHAAEPDTDPEIRYYHDLPVDVITKLGSEDGKAALRHVFHAVLSVVDVIDGETLLRIAPEAGGWLSLFGGGGEGGSGLPGLLLFTLKSNRRPVGMVSMSFDRPRAWSAREKEVLSLLGQQLGLVLENALLFEVVQAARREWEATVDSLRDMVLLVGLDGKIMRANRAMAEYAGMPIRELVGRECSEVFACGGAYEGCPHIRGALEREAESYEMVDAENREYRVLITPYLDASGKVAGTVHLASDITEEKAILRLEEEKRQLQELDRLKNRFMASVTHELKTPLNAIIGFSELLLSGTYGELEERQRRYLENIHAGGKHLLDLITEILDYMRLQAESFPLNIEELEATDLLRAAADIMRQEAARGGIELRVEAEGGPHRIEADRRRVSQVLFNLISNAIKFTPPGGRVTLRAYSRDDGVVMEVRDTGIGISSEDQKRLFREFTQVGEGAKRGGGTGLGLALSKKLVELHGGKIWVDSVPGKGSVFSFLLPSRPEREDEEEVVAGGETR
ncbi:MAG: PAS domain-containing sensor histidine kinase [Actinobacteria bacterium]|nr:PAS domain-containing sensor histidine kinase [Actinomycetota bacterium]